MTIFSCRERLSWRDCFSSLLIDKVRFLVGCLSVSMFELKAFLKLFRIRVFLIYHNFVYLNIKFINHDKVSRENITFAFFRRCRPLSLPLVVYLRLMFLFEYLALYCTLNKWRHFWMFPSVDCSRRHIFK